MRGVATLLLLLLPLLARADPHYGLEGLFWVVVLGGGLLLLLTALSIGLTVLSYRQPHRRGLYRAQLVLLALNALPGLGLALLGTGFEKLLPLPFNPYWGLGLPVGLWLNSIRWARQATGIAWGRLWASVAVGAFGLLLGLLVSWVLGAWLGRYNAIYYLGRELSPALIWPLAALSVLGSWAVVSRQLRAWLPAAVWHPWWLPLLTAGATITFTTYGSCLPLIFSKYHYVGTAEYFYRVGQAFLLYWVLGVVALLLLRPARHAVRPANQ